MLLSRIQIDWTRFLLRTLGCTWNAENVEVLLTHYQASNSYRPLLKISTSLEPTHLSWLLSACKPARNSTCAESGEWPYLCLTSYRHGHRGNDCPAFPSLIVGGRNSICVVRTVMDPLPYDCAHAKIPRSNHEINCAHSRHSSWGNRVHQSPFSRPKAERYSSWT